MFKQNEEENQEGEDDIVVGEIEEVQEDDFLDEEEVVSHEEDLDIREEVVEEDHETLQRDDLRVVDDMDGKNKIV